MIAANVLMSRSLQPLDLVVATWKPFVQAREAFLRLEALLEKYPPRVSGADHKVLRGEITLETLVATAAGREQPILYGLNAHIPAGKVVVIIGPSGSGKSTMAQCILGIWPEYKGRVLLDGKDVHSWEREALGPHVGYLPQDIELF